MKTYRLLVKSAARCSPVCLVLSLTSLGLGSTNPVFANTVLPSTKATQKRSKNLFPRARSNSPVVLDRLEASVNSSLILLSDVVRFRKTLALRAQIDPLFAGSKISKGGAAVSDAEIVDFLIEDRLILDQFPVKDAEAEQEINSIQSTNRIDRKALRAALKEQGFTFDEYFSLIQVSLSKRSLIDRDIRTKVFISDDDVKNYFYNHLQNATNTPFSYKIQIITVSPENYKTSSAALNTIQTAHRALKGGESFHEVAKRYSDDPSAPEGGELGMLPEEEISAQIRQAVKKLKVGEFSDILGGNGSRWFVIKLVDIKSGEEEKLARTKEQIRNQLNTTEYQNQIALWLQRQRLASFIRLAGQPTFAKNDSTHAQ